MYKVTKSQARTAYANGTVIQLCPSKQSLITSFKVGINPDCSGPFDEAVDIFRANECTVEAGKAVHYYIA